jgi:hypothetical protein
MILSNVKKAMVPAGAAALMLSSTSQAALNAADITAVETEILADFALVGATAVVLLGTFLAFDVGIGVWRKYTKRTAR